MHELRALSRKNYTCSRKYFRVTEYGIEGYRAQSGAYIQVCISNLCDNTTNNAASGRKRSVAELFRAIDFQSRPNGAGPGFSCLPRPDRQARRATTDAYPDGSEANPVIKRSSTSATSARARFLSSARAMRTAPSVMAARGIWARWSTDLAAALLSEYKHGIAALSAGASVAGLERYASGAWRRESRA